jgi:hypothetical protein
MDDPVLTDRIARDNARRNINVKETIGKTYTIPESVMNYGYKELFNRLNELRDNVLRKNIMIKDFEEDALNLIKDINDLIGDIFDLIDKLKIAAQSLPEDQKKEILQDIRDANNELQRLLENVGSVDISGLTQIIQELVKIRIRLESKLRQGNPKYVERNYKYNRDPSTDYNVFTERKGGRHRRRTTRKRSSRRKTMGGAKRKSGVHKKRRSTRRRR